MSALDAGRTFEAYGPTHWMILAGALLGALLLVLLGRALRGRVEESQVSRGFAVVLVSFQLPMQLYNLLPPQWSPQDSLPLHLSDLAWMTAAYALWTRRWWAFTLTYYWGLTLTPQAMVTPALDAPSFPHIAFVEFWGHHLMVLWAAVFLTWGCGMRPNWRGYRLAVGATVAWGLSVLAFNTVAGTNYGFVNHKPSNPSLLDLMGGWPWYLGVELLVGMLAWALITLPWTVRRNRTAAPLRKR